MTVAEAVKILRDIRKIPTSTFTYYLGVTLDEKVASEIANLLESLDQARAATVYSDQEFTMFNASKVPTPPASTTSNGAGEFLWDIGLNDAEAGDREWRIAAKTPADARERAISEINTLVPERLHGSLTIRYFKSA